VPGNACDVHSDKQQEQAVCRERKKRQMSLPALTNWLLARFAGGEQKRYWRFFMSEHRVTLSWQRTTPDFDVKSYSRDHTVTFKNGRMLAMSATPDYRGNPDNVDPEETFVAAMASCHMLTFLALASKQGLVVDSYEDEPVGILEKNDAGKMAITRVIMRPRITFADNAPDIQTLREMHDKAHGACFIANSAKTAVEFELPEPATTA